MVLPDLFNVPIFFIVLRETVEVALIMSILLSFLRRIFDPDSLIYRHLKRRIWLGALVGFVICLVIAVTFIVIWYIALRNLWEETELIWEAVFCIITAVLTTVTALAMLTTEQMEEKWKIKLADTLESAHADGFLVKVQRRSFFVLPMVTVMREGLEAIMFTSGVSLDVPAQSIPIPAILGLLCGILFGIVIYGGGRFFRIRWFFTCSSIVLCLLAAGLTSRAVGFIEQYQWDCVIEDDNQRNQHPVIDYKVPTAIWHVSWGANEGPNTNGGWQLFRALLGWSNTATIDSVIIYNAYWIFIIFTLVYVYWSQKRAAIRRATTGEWQEGDMALENAEAYVDPNGDIIQATASASMHDSTADSRDKHHSLDYLDNVMAISLQHHVSCKQF
ncbi:iron permease FTR1 family-domain-containing protein [Fennellomyces sp. T-0311]|nr:iron permease FTR1 family-domain-containing protein [Fennellomyces sp. T-0311]